MSRSVCNKVDMVLKMVFEAAAPERKKYSLKAARCAPQFSKR